MQLLGFRQGRGDRFRRETGMSSSDSASARDVEGGLTALPRALRHRSSPSASFRRSGLKFATSLGNEVDLDSTISVAHVPRAATAAHLRQIIPDHICRLNAATTCEDLHVVLHRHTLCVAVNSNDS